MDEKTLLTEIRKLMALADVIDKQACNIKPATKSNYEELDKLQNLIMVLDDQISNLERRMQASATEAH